MREETGQKIEREGAKRREKKEEEVGRKSEEREEGDRIGE